MPSYKLTYFPSAGITEPICFLFSYAGIDFVNERIHYKNWSKVKQNIAAFHYEKNEEAKQQKIKAAKETVPFYLERLDAQVKKNGGYFVSGALTWADFMFVGLLPFLNFMMKENIVEKYENLKQLQKKVEEIPSIKNWIDEHPSERNVKFVE